MLRGQKVDLDKAELIGMKHFKDDIRGTLSIMFPSRVGSAICAAVYHAAVRPELPRTARTTKGNWSEISLTRFQSIQLQYQTPL